jgi:flagellar motor protein MotB
MAEEKRQAGRPIGKRHQEDVRSKIQATQIINRLYSAFQGEVELTAIQVNIAKTLLDKVLPDLKAIEQTTQLTADVEVYAWQE